MKQPRKSERVEVRAALTASVFVVSLLTATSSSAQTYQGYPSTSYDRSYQEYYDWYYRTYGRSRGIDCCIFDEPGNSIHLRGGFGGGGTYGALQGLGWGYNADLAIGIRLVGETSGRLDWDFIHLLIEGGFRWMGYKLQESTEMDSGIYSAYLGFLGTRFGWGGYAFNLFTLGRVLVGATEEAYIGGGLQVGLGAELYFGALGVEVSYLWLYYEEIGNSHAVRASAYIDVIQVFMGLCEIVGC